MRLHYWLIGILFFVALISFFMLNMNIEKLSIVYFWGRPPIHLFFWELVTACIALGVVVTAVVDFITQFHVMREHKRMAKRDKEHQGEVNRLNIRISELQKENERLTSDLDRKSKEFTELETKTQPRATTETVSSYPETETGPTESRPDETVAKTS